MNNSSDKAEQWFDSQRQEQGFLATVSDKPMAKPWLIDPHSPTPIKRSDNAFFVLKNIDVFASDSREISAWSQPMLEEIGKGLVVLFVKKVQNEILFLVQAKAEPGNDCEGSILLAPSIQASLSNLEQAHGGKSVALFEQINVPQDSDLIQKAYYNKSTKVSSTAVSQKPDSIAPNLSLLSAISDGGRFFHKKNEHAIIDITTLDQKTIDSNNLPENFRWVDKRFLARALLKGQLNEHLLKIIAMRELLLELVE